MIALRIEDQKAFTSELFVGGTFDAFLVREANITTFNSFSIDGRIRPGYYSAGEAEENGVGEYSAWRVLRPVCYSLIRGKRLPVSFRIVFLLSPDARERFIASHAQKTAPGAVGGLYLNVSYENGALNCTTGVSMNVFTPDRTAEREWDESVARFFRQKGIAFSQM